MNCKNCGSPLAEGTVFCTNCGTPVELDSAPTEPISQIQQDQYPQQDQNVQPQQDPYAQQNQYNQPQQDPYAQQNQYGQPQQPYPYNTNQQQYNQYQPPIGAQFYEDMTAAQLGSQVYTYGLIGFIASFFVSIVGLIFSIISFNKAKQYQAYTGGLYNKAKTGKNFATAGLIISIVSMVIALLTICCIGCLAFTSGSYSELSNYYN